MDERKRSLRKEIVRLAFPIALQQFMTALVGACDAIMLGKLSQDAMSAVSLATQVTFVFNLFMFAFMAGEEYVCGTILWKRGLHRYFPGVQPCDKDLWMYCSGISDRNPFLSGTAHENPDK